MSKFLISCRVLCVLVCVVVCVCVVVVLWRCGLSIQNPCVLIQNVPVCTFKTPPCVPAPRAHVFQHALFLPAHTEAFFERTHGHVSNGHTEVLNGQTHHTATAPPPQHTHQNTRHNTTQRHDHNTTRRQRETETDADRERKKIGTE